jgi:hypothetical protein
MERDDLGWGHFNSLKNLSENQGDKCCIPCKSKENGKTNFQSRDLMCRASDFYLFLRAKRTIFTRGACWVSKNAAELYVDFKNITFS